MDWENTWVQCVYMRLYFIMCYYDWVVAGGGVGGEVLQPPFPAVIFKMGGGGEGLWKYDYCDVCYFVMGFDGDVLRCAMVTHVHKSFLCNLLAC